MVIRQARYNRWEVRATKENPLYPHNSYVPTIEVAFCSHVDRLRAQRCVDSRRKNTNKCIG